MAGDRAIRRTRPALAVLAAAATLVAVDACGGSLTSSAPTTTAPASVSAPATTTGAVTTGSSPSAASAALINCDRAAVSAPTNYTLACADGGIWLDSLHWSAWGSPTANASGNLWENNCDPNCASGKEISYPASVTASGLDNGSYTRLHVSAPQAPGNPFDYTVGPAGPQ